MFSDMQITETAIAVVGSFGKEKGLHNLNN